MPSWANPPRTNAHDHRLRHRTSVTFDAETDYGFITKCVSASCFITPSRRGGRWQLSRGAAQAKTAAVSVRTNGDTYSRAPYIIFLWNSAGKWAWKCGGGVYCQRFRRLSPASSPNIRQKKTRILFLTHLLHDVGPPSPTQAAAAGIKGRWLGRGRAWASVLDLVTRSAADQGAYYCSGYSPEDNLRARCQVPRRLKKRLTGGAQHVRSPGLWTQRHPVRRHCRRRGGAARNMAPPTYLQAIIDAMKGHRQGICHGPCDLRRSQRPAADGRHHQLQGRQGSVQGQVLNPIGTRAPEGGIPPSDWRVRRVLHKAPGGQVVELERPPRKGTDPWFYFNSF